MVGSLLLALSVAPLVAIAGCLLVRRRRICEALNLTASTVSLACAVQLPFLIDGQQLLIGKTT